MGKKNLILFRADGNRQIGFGHIMRCLHLAEEFTQNEYYVIFLMKNFSESVKKVQEHRIEVIKMPITDNDNLEIEIIKKVYKEKKGSVLLLDKYFNMKQEYLDNIKNAVDKLIVINDYGEIDLRNHFVINVNDNLNYKVHNLSCMGPSYAIISDKMILCRKEKLKISDKVETIVISMGGGDTNNLTPKVLSFLNKYEKKYYIIVILGPGYKDTTEIKKFCSQSKHRIEIVHNPDNIGEHFIRGDIAITSGGVTKFETAFLGIPSIILCQNDYEHSVTEIFEKHKSLINLGVGEQINIEEFKDSFSMLVNSKDLRMEMSLNGKQCVDGIGKKRIVERVKKYIEING